MQAERVLPDVTCGLAEGPVWDDRAGRFYWVDIKAPCLHGFDPDTGDHHSWDWPETVSCCGLAEDGRVLLAGLSGIWAFDPDTGARAVVYDIPALPDGLRTNDGKVGPDGAFWVSTMHDVSDRGPVGVVMRVAPDGEVRVMLEGITTANGMEWSPDGRTFYLADTRELWVDCWEYDPETVTLSNRRRFITLGEGDGKPDGAGLGANGSYWLCGIYAGLVHQFAADGTRIGHVSVPAEMVTMPCFGGKDMRTMLITSLHRGADSVEGDGGIFTVRVETPGPSPRRMTVRS